MGAAVVLFLSLGCCWALAREEVACGLAPLAASLHATDRRFGFLSNRGRLDHGGGILFAAVVRYNGDTFQRVVTIYRV